MSVVTSAESKKLVEYLLNDLRQLSTEAKKKHSPVKEAAETGVVRVRNISSASSENTLLTNLRAASTELLHPLILASATKQTKLVQIALQGIQRLVQYRILEASCANVVVNELWNLVDSECEELRVLQTVPPLVSAHLLITGNNLAKCIVMCFRLHFAKDPVVINAASAAVRQVVSGVFERVNQEDEVFSNELTVVPTSGGRPSPRSAPPTLRPCAADAFLLFRDLCLVINAEPAVWLVGMREITRTLGLELLETLLKNYPGVFFKHMELASMVKQEVCQLVIKLFSPSLKPSNSRLSMGSGSPTERPYFPIAMRLVRVVVVLLSNYHQILPTECEIFISHFIKFVENDKNGWQRVVALEALHKVISQPGLLRWMGENFDSRENSSTLVRSIAECFTSAVKSCFSHPQPVVENEATDGETNVHAGIPGFYYNNVWMPYIELLTSKKTPFMDCLEKHEAGVVPEGYVISRCCSAVNDFCQSLYSSVDQLTQRNEEMNGNGAASTEENVAKVLFSSAFSGLFPAIGILMNSSVDETVVDQLLCSLSMIVSIGFRLKAVTETQCALYLMSAASTPAGGYLANYGALQKPAEYTIADSPIDGVLRNHQVVATGSPCPSPFVSPDIWNQQVMITSRSLQASKVLLGVLSSHVEGVDGQWYFCLSICQHLSWLMAIRPYSNGVFGKEKMEPDSMLPPLPSNMPTITTAALSETPMLASFFDKVFSSSSALSQESLSLILDALTRLSDEQAAVAATGRECSLFPLAGLLRVAVVNLYRIKDVWPKITAHFLKMCGHSSGLLRDWSALSLTTLVRSAMKAKTDLSEDEQQKLCYSSLNAMSDTTSDEVRRRQLDCLMSSMQKDGSSLHPSTWPILIEIVASVVAQDSCCDEALVRQGYLGVRLMSADFLQNLPFGSVPALVEAIARYGSQQADQNISLSALALLWTISDFIYRKADVIEVTEVEKVWLVVYTCLSELCVDSRHSVRKSACQTLLQTVVAHGHALRAHTWNHMIWQILIPLLEKVRTQTRSASTEKTSKGLIMHHSRDTEQKQWTETCINTMSAACKMYIAQRKVLLKLEDFGSAWEALLSYLEWGAGYDNAELSLCALKSFQEVLLGRVSAQTLDINTRDRSSSSPDAPLPEQIPQLPVAQWIESWNSWNRIARGMAKQASSMVGNQGLQKGAYIPGPSHLTTLLHMFPPLFYRVSKHVNVSELNGDQLPSVMESLASIPVPLEQAPFVLPSSTSQITPTQEAVLDASKSIFAECVGNTEGLRAAIPDQIRLLLRFAAFSIHPSPRLCPTGKNYNDWAQQFLIPFAELSLRMAVDFYTSTASQTEVARSLVVIDIIKFLGDALHAKYQCINSSSWKMAGSSLMTVLRVVIPHARQQGDVYASLWPAVCETLEKFLFSPNTCHTLAADERKRDELAECQVVELVRSEILPYSSSLPAASVQRLISILNRGSISQLDPNDILDSHMQRAELARTCFDALLSTSNSEVGGIGHVAVSSLLERCSHVMTDFVRDWTGAGDLRLPRTRLAEITAALQAVESLIDRLSRDRSLSELYSQLVGLYPIVVDVVPCCRDDPQLNTQMVTTLKAYQTLMLLKLIPRQQ